MGYKIAIFDMDGTVLNTLGDLTDAMNYAFKEAGYDAFFTEADTKQFFGSGVEVAIKRALAIIYGASFESLVAVGTKEEKLPEEITAEEVQRISTIYRPFYDSHCDIKTGPYEGIPEAIETLRKNGILTAVVSNKPDIAVQKLVRDDFEGLFDFSLGEKQGVKRKPAPDMVNHTLHELLRNAEEPLNEVKKQAVYIGDSEIDIQTAKNSGLDCISVDWGFRSHDFLLKHGASVIVKSPLDMAGEIMAK